MKARYLSAVSAAAMLVGAPALAQTGATSSAQNTQPTLGAGQEAVTGDNQPQLPGDIIVTAQRQSQRLQDVPIAVTAFTAENLEKQQIVNPTALQQTLPNITFTKTNFTSSSFTIRGVGDLCVGTSCDQATAIHVNDMPFLSTRLFEAEFFDLERVEVLRGPQGTLFGRNATSGVVNFITAKPDLSRIGAAGEFEYGNYDNKRARAMLNLPITDTIGIRVAGTYLNRDGFTRNLFDNSRIDDRDLYALRGTLSWEPSSDTRIDLIGYYFHEDDRRSRIQKQLCHRDPTGILGCSPDTLRFETANGLSTLAAVLSSSELFTISNPALGRFGLQSVYGVDPYTGVVNPRDVRTVRLDYNPTYFAEEEQYTAKVFHDFGPVSVNLTGGYATNSVRSRTDYNLAVENPLTNNAGLVQLNALGRPGSPFALLNGVRQRVIPNGPAGGVCQSAPDPNNVGVYGGNTEGCFQQSLDFDESGARNRQYSIEGHIDSSFDGIFNFLLGGIYFDSKTTNSDYYVTAFGLDYGAGILGSASATNPALGLPASAIANGFFLAPPFYRSRSDLFRLKSYGVFGEAYFQFNEDLKLTLGLRYNNDRKFTTDRVLTANVLTPIGATDFTQGINYNTVDFDATVPGRQEFAVRSAKFDALTGRAVIDYKITRDNLLYASYSRGYKSGGINPPIPPEFQVPVTFSPESVDAFEIGSKNTFGNGQLRLNLTGFYYKYKDLQLSRIVNRTSVNDNIDADIYGVEAEAVLSPTPRFVVNMNASYLKTKVVGGQRLPNPRDPSGGRSDVVIIKDIQSAANCAVVPTVAGNAVGANTFVAAVNQGIGAASGNPGLLRAPTAVPGTNATGAYSLCSQLTTAAATPPAALRALFATPTGALPFQVVSGVDVAIDGNKLPQAPTYKFAVGAQYTIDLGSGGWTLVPRGDLNYTGNTFGTIFNRNIDRIQGYEVVNAQIQLNAPDDRFYLRGFVSNLTANDATTGLYVTDQSSGLYTNIFTIEPRRYGVAAGFKF